MPSRKIFIDVTKKSPEPVRLKNPPGQVSKLVKVHPSKTANKNSDFLKEFPRIEHPFWKKSKGIAVFLTIGLAIVSALNIIVIAKNGLQLKSNLSLAATEGLQTLQKGANFILHSKFPEADRAFSEAARKFSDAEKELWFLSQNGNSLESAKNVTESGKLLAEAGKLFSRMISRLKDLPALFLDENPGPSITEKIKAELPDIEQAFAKLSQAGALINQVDIHLIPQDKQKEFEYARTLLTSLSENIEKYHDGLQGFLTLLGDARPHQILVLLQNNAELRPTGGFIGSYALLTLNDGYLVKNEFHDVYETDYQLKETIEPPEELKALSPRWFLRDSNYSPDFPVSGEKAAWFLQKSKGPSVDSVMAIDQSVLADLLDITGPVYVPSLKNFLTKDNFNLVLSYVIESKLSGRENPKALMAEFFPLFQKQLFQNIRQAKTLQIFMKAIRERHLMAYSREKDTEAFFRLIGTDGSFENPDQNEDFLSVVETNIGGNKSDAYMQENITHTTFINENGFLEDEVAIEKTHAWDRQTTANLVRVLNSFGFSELSDQTKDILGRGKNVTAVRVYVPDGAVLTRINGIPAEDIPIADVVTKKDPDTGQTYFFTKIETERGIGSRISLRYRLPFHLYFGDTSEYRLRVQKQMGTPGASFIKNFSPEGPLELVKSYSSCSEILKTDCSLAALWKN